MGGVSFAVQESMEKEKRKNRTRRPGREKQGMKFPYWYSLIGIGRRFLVLVVGVSAVLAVWIGSMSRCL